jgi:hypothetical protein
MEGLLAVHSVLASWRAALEEEGSVNKVLTKNSIIMHNKGSHY